MRLKYDLILIKKCDCKAKNTTKTRLGSKVISLEKTLVLVVVSLISTANLENIENT